MNRRQALKAIAAVPIAVAAGVSTARETMVIGRTLDAQFARNAMLRAIVDNAYIAAYPMYKLEVGTLKYTRINDDEFWAE